MAKYTTKIRKRKNTRNYALGKWSNDRNVKGKKKLNKKRREKIKKIAYTALGAFVIASFVSIVLVLWYVQQISKDLPSPDEPFGSKNSASVIYDRNGEQLYKVYGNENRDPLELPEDGKITDVVTNEMVWAVLAAEDIDFYQHPGFDVTSTTKCAFKNAAGTSGCGGSTITQQLVKQTVLTNEKKIERKVKELILALQVERKYSKDQILAMYMTVAPMGSNVYGVNTGARFYFGKDLDELTLAETAVLASLPQNPSVLSPTLSTDPEGSKEKLDTRKNYVLDQMLKYKNKINREVGDDQFITEEKIEEARNQELVYIEPRIDIKAPHFVFYVQKLLQERGYNDGVPFTLADLETSGLKIYTTMDYELQKSAEKQVLEKGVGKYGAQYGSKNAGMTVVRPSTGEVLVYVGSKDYFAEKEGKLFDPKVDLLTSLQQPGSSAKPITYYNAFNTAVAAPGTQLMDIPIEIGNYKPKNSDGSFSGIHSARYHLVHSKNIPAIELLMATGVAQYIDTAKTFGYTTFGEPSNYGPAITLGAADVKPIEHAEAFGVFANGGDHVQHEVIMKIEDKNGKVIYEADPQKERVADERAIYLVNDVLKGVPVDGINNFKGDGRQVAAKTGTSESQIDTWYALYSPDFVAIGYLGNNDNTPMRSGAFGSTSVKPWVQEYMSSILAYFPEKTAFSRPGGITQKQICQEISGSKVCEGESDLMIEGKEPPVYIARKNFTVCDDQQDRLAREIDISTGHSMEKTFTKYLMPAEELQEWADRYLSGKGMIFPTEQCTVDRSPNEGKPWAVVSSPTTGGTYTGNMSVSFTAYTTAGIVSKVEIYIDSTKYAETTTLPYSGTLDISGLSAGTHTLRLKVYDSVGNMGETTVSFGISNGGFTINSPSGTDLSSPVNVSASFTGSGTPSNVKFCVNGSCTISMSGSGSGPYTATWSPSAGTYQIQVKSDGGYSSSVKTVTIL
ncbi:penicillin-binding protein [Candidatus Dojkabacteria bacterium]|nr:penicillin-binding protein [Candidatus Dojkabacteria bacterium]